MNTITSKMTQMTIDKSKLKYTRACNNILTKGECNRANCTFAHTKQQYRHTPCQYDPNCNNPNCVRFHETFETQEQYEKRIDFQMPNLPNEGETVDKDCLDNPVTLPKIEHNTNIEFTVPCNNMLEHGTCSRMNCTFAHYKQQFRPHSCINGHYCPNKDCEYFHETRETLDMFKQRVKSFEIPNLPDAPCYIQQGTDDSDVEVVIDRDTCSTSTDTEEVVKTNILTTIPWSDVVQLNLSQSSVCLASALIQSAVNSGKKTVLIEIH